MSQPPTENTARTPESNSKGWGLLSPFGGWFFAVLFAAATALVAVYFLGRENQWLRQELQKHQGQSTSTAAPAATVTPTAPRWLPSGSQEPMPLPVVEGNTQSTPAPLATPIPALPNPSPSPVAVATPLISNLLKGRVLDEAGKGVANVEVTIAPPAPGYPESQRTTRTNAQGQFTLTGIPVESLPWVRFNAEGFATIESQDIPLPLDDFEITMNRLVGLDIRVVRRGPDGADQPVDALITLLILRQKEAQPPVNPSGQPTDKLAGIRPGEFATISVDAVTLAGGRWRTGQLEPAIYKVGVVLDGEYAESEPQRLDAVMGGEATVRLGVRQKLQGEVRGDPDQTPVQGARISLLMTSRPSPAGPAIPISGQTSAQGSFEIGDVPPGTYRVTLSSDLHSTKVLEGIPVLPGPPPEPAVFYLKKTLPGMSVTVRNASGEAVADAPVTVAATGRTGTGPWFGQTDSNGVYQIESLPPGRYSISASLPGPRGRQPGPRERQRMREVIVEEDGIQAMEIRFLNQVDVKGRIQRDGKPYNGSVSVRAKDSVVAESLFRTDDKGLFSTLLEPGEWLLVPSTGPGTGSLQVREEMAQPVEVTFE